MDRVAIVGAGQIGTMLGMALVETGADVALYDLDAATLERSLARAAGARALAGADEALAADIVVLAVPVSEIIRLVRDLGPRLRPGTLVLDTGSAKRAVVEAMRLHAAPLSHAVGGHPMVGTEQPGPGGAVRDLLRGATFALSPVREDADGLVRASRFVQSLGARPLLVDAEEHDRLVARTSHLAHLAAYALVEVASRLEHLEAHTLVGPGFRLATRLAASHPGTVAAFLRANAAQTRAASREFADALRDLADGLEEDGLPARLAAIRQARERLV